MRAAEITVQLGRPEHRGTRWRCLCPIHGGHSLELADGDSELLVTCWAGCETKAVLAELRNRGLLSSRRDHEDRRANCPAPKRPPNDSDEHTRIKVARRIWAQGENIAGTKVQKYLAARGLPAVSNQSLRFTPGFLYAPGVVLPAMLAAVASPTKKIICVQVTMLSLDGLRKARVATQRRAYGVLRDSAIRLAPVDDVIGLAEEVESALSAAAIQGVPTWASFGAQRLDRLAIPSSVRRIVLFGDNDDAGREAVARAQRAYATRDREI